MKRRHRLTALIRRYAYAPSTDALVRATVAVSILLVMLTVATLWYTAQGRIGDQRAQRSDDLRSCTSSFSAELVTGPTTAALKALALHGGDSPQFRAAVDEADPQRFKWLAQLSRTDPDRFLRICHEADPG